VTRPDAEAAVLAVGVDGRDLAQAREAADRIMARRPTPIVAVIGSVVERGELVFSAVTLEAAADKPMAPLAQSSKLRAQVRQIARLPVVRPDAKLSGKATGSVPPPPSPPPPPGSAPRRRPSRETRAATSPRLIVGVAASAGGPMAVATVLGELGSDFPGCVAVVQHLPVGFADSFTRYLQRSTRLRIALVRGPTPARAGTVLVPIDDRHLVAWPDHTFRPSDAPPVGGHRPSATKLLQSIAEVWGDLAIGVVLTGIGDDGAAGLSAMRARGGLTVAQDEATSTVYGMPGAASKSGAAELILPLEQIGPAVVARARSIAAAGKDAHTSQPPDGPGPARRARSGSA
jgi:two-component system chemotaxis response regulator CheB